MKKVLLGLMFVLLGTAIASAQRTVTGKVTDETGEPLIGATVSVPGTSGGAVTDVNGVYRLELPANGTVLRFTYTGYIQQDIAITDSNVYSPQMQTDLSNLQEVVVVGYGTQQKRDITGNVSTVKGEDLPGLPAQSFDQLLQGRAAGVNINIPNGVLNNPPVFRIRGINSINLSSFPLVVIDGVPTFTGDLSANSAANNPLSNLNPNDIESIDILKDASATAIYGSRASAGVVLITTKRGKKGKTRVNYDGSASWTQATRVPEVLNAQQYVEIKNEAAANANLVGPQFFLDSVNGQLIDTRWADYIYRTGFSHNHGLSFSGGSDQTTYFLSLGYTNQEGMIVKNTFERLSSRLNLDHKIGKRIKVGATVGFGKNNNGAPNTGSLNGQAFNTSGLGRLAFVTAPVISPYNADGSYNINSSNQPGRGKNKQQVGFANPVPIIDNNTFTSEANQIQASAFGQLEILKGLILKTQYGIDNVNVESKSFQYPGHGDGFGTNGLASNSVFKNQRWNWQNTLNFDRSFGGKNNLGVVVGNEQQGTTTEGWGAQRTQAGDPFFTTYQGLFTTINPISLFQSENYLLSYFGRLNYDFDKKYYVSVNLRQDEYSAFAAGQKRGIFWGASAGWTISEEQFWQDIFGSNVNYFKLRGSYGVVGNNNGLNDFASQSLFNSALYGPSPTIFYSQAGNAELSWESSKKTDIGAVFGLFGDRLQGEISYYKNLVDGVILPAPQAPSKGIPGNSVLINVGSFENTGWEFGIGGTIVRAGKFSWQSNINFTTSNNEVLTLSEDKSDITGSTGGLETANIIRIGESIGSLYVVPTDGVNPENGRRIFIKRDGTRVQYNHVVPTGQSRWTTLDGATATAATVAADGVIYGPTLPTWFGGWDNTFTYGGFDLNVQCNYAGGNYVYNGSKAGLRDQRFWNNHTDVLDRWTENNKEGSIPRVVFGDNLSNGSAFPISENVEKGDFLRIRNITLGYRLPSSLLQRGDIASLRVFASVNNAFLITKYTGTDPEVSTNGNSNTAPGVDRNTVPMPRAFILGVSLGL